MNLRNTICFVFLYDPEGPSVGLFVCHTYPKSGTFPCSFWRTCLITIHNAAFWNVASILWTQYYFQRTIRSIEKVFMPWKQYSHPLKSQSITISLRVMGVSTLKTMFTISLHKLFLVMRYLLSSQPFSSSLTLFKCHTLETSLFSFVTNRNVVSHIDLLSAFI